MDKIIQDALYAGAGIAFAFFLFTVIYALTHR